MKNILKKMKTAKKYIRLSKFLSNLEERKMKVLKEFSVKKKDEKYVNFEFNIKHLLIFDKSGFLLINSSIAEYTKLSPKFIDKIKLLIEKVIHLDLKYFDIFFKHYKIFILNKNFIYVAILSNKYNSCLVRLYLLFINVMFINLLGENIINQNYVNLSKISKIVEVYFIPPLSSKFSHAIEYILSKKEANSSKYLYKFKNLFIYYIENNGDIIPLFDYRKIIHCKELKYKYNIRKNENILNYITNILLEPIYNNNYINRSDIYSHSLELLSTFPRWMIIGKYLKIYNGIFFVQLYSAKKLSKITMNYQEFQINEQQSMDDYYKITSKHSNKFLKFIEFFLYNYFETISDLMNKYCNPNNELLYFDIDLLIVTNDVISLKVLEDSLVNLVYKRLQLNRIKMGKDSSILLEEKSENSNSNSNSGSSKNSKSKNVKYNSITWNDNIINDNESSSSISITSVSKTFLQLDLSDILKDLKRKSIQFSSFDGDMFFDDKSEFSEIWNISCIKNTNQNNYDIRSLFSNIPGDKKFSGFDSMSILDKQEKSNQNISRRPTDKQINIFKGHRNSIGPTFNIIVNNNNNNNEIDNRKISIRSLKNNIMNNRKISMKSIKKRKTSIIFNNKATTVKKNNNKNNKINSRANTIFKRSNSSTTSGLYLNQFYSLINNNPRFFKTKYQILKEIQNEIKQSFSKKNNSFMIENKYDKNKKEKKERKIVKISKNVVNAPFYNNEQEMKKDILQEYYEDKSSINFLENNNNFFGKLNDK